MKRGNQKKPDIGINKIIVESTAVLVSVFITIGLVMSQVFDEGATRFYELLGWSISLTIPFILSSLFSVLVIAYYDELCTNHRKLLKIFKNISIILFLFAWVSLIVHAYTFSPDYFIGNLEWFWGFGWLFTLGVCIIMLIWFSRKNKHVTLDSYV